MAANWEVPRRGASDAELVASAYRELLKLPHGVTRLLLQGTLAALRDELAALTHRTPEDVQNEYEARPTVRS